MAVETNDGQVQGITGDVTVDLSSYKPSELKEFRNQAGGFWVASTVPEAADHAVTGTLDASEVRRVVLMTDGVSRLVERYGWSWQQIIDVSCSDGPAAVIDAVREAERATAPGTYRGKLHDDATLALCSNFTGSHA
jgi:hypothetical protein